MDEPAKKISKTFENKTCEDAQENLDDWITDVLSAKNDEGEKLNDQCGENCSYSTTQNIFIFKKINSCVANGVLLVRFVSLKNDFHYTAEASATHSWICKEANQ